MCGASIYGASATVWNVGERCYADTKGVGRLLWGVEALYSLSLAFLFLSCLIAFFLIFILFSFLIVSSLFLLCSSCYSSNIYWPIVSTLSLLYPRLQSDIRAFGHMHGGLVSWARFWLYVGVFGLMRVSALICPHPRLPLGIIRWARFFYMGAYLSLTTSSSFKFFVM